MGDVRLPSRVEHTYTLVARTPHTSNGTRRDHWFLRAHARHVSGLSGTHRTLPPAPAIQPGSPAGIYRRQAALTTRPAGTSFGPPRPISPRSAPMYMPGEPRFCPPR